MGVVEIIFWQLSIFFGTKRKILFVELAKIAIIFGNGIEDQTIPWDGRHTSLYTDQIQMSFTGDRGVMQSTPRSLEQGPSGSPDRKYVILDQVSERADSCVLDIHSTSSSSVHSLHSAHDVLSHGPVRLQFPPQSVYNFADTNQDDVYTQQYINRGQTYADFNQQESRPTQAPAMQIPHAAQPAPTQFRNFTHQDNPVDNLRLPSQANVFHRHDPNRPFDRDRHFETDYMDRRTRDEPPLADRHFVQTTPNARPDGRSGGELFPPRRTIRRLDTFNGESVALDDYLGHFELIAAWNHWSEEEKALQLGASLRGPAQRVLGDTPLQDRLNYYRLKEALENRFSPRDRQLTFEKGTEVP